MRKKRRKREKGRACTCRDAVAQGRTRSRRDSRRRSGQRDSRESRLERWPLRGSKSRFISIHPFGIRDIRDSSMASYSRNASARVIETILFSVSLFNDFMICLRNANAVDFSLHESRSDAHNVRRILTNGTLGDHSRFYRRMRDLNPMIRDHV